MNDFYLSWIFVHHIWSNRDRWTGKVKERNTNAPPPCAYEGGNNVRHTIALFDKKIKMFHTIKPTIQDHPQKSDTTHL